MSKRHRTILLLDDMNLYYFDRSLCRAAAMYIYVSNIYIIYIHQTRTSIHENCTHVIYYQVNIHIYGNKSGNIIIQVTVQCTLLDTLKKYTWYHALHCSFSRVVTILTL